MPYADYKAFKIRTEGGIARVTVDHPPLNLFDATMFSEIGPLTEELRNDSSVRVVLFDSADRDFFMGHADLSLFLGERHEVPPKAGLNPLQVVFENLRTLPKATIAILEGRAIGGGAEFLLACDMIFAARGKATLSLFEVALGGIPGATGTQRLPRLLGRARALEAILGCDDFDADLAERYGYVNRAFEPGELRPFVDRLARRIASFPARAIALAKVAVDAAELPIHDGLVEEMHVVNQILVGGEHQRRMRAFLAAGGQTESFERAGFHAALEKIF